MDFFFTAVARELVPDFAFPPFAPSGRFFFAPEFCDPVFFAAFVLAASSTAGLTEPICSVSTPFEVAGVAEAEAEASLATILLSTLLPTSEVFAVALGAVVFGTEGATIGVDAPLAGVVLLTDGVAEFTDGVAEFAVGAAGVVVLEVCGLVAGEPVATTGDCFGAVSCLGAASGFCVDTGFCAASCFGAATCFAFRSAFSDFSTGVVLRGTSGFAGCVCDFVTTLGVEAAGALDATGDFAGASVAVVDAGLSGTAGAAVAATDWATVAGED